MRKLLFICLLACAATAAAQSLILDSHLTIGPMVTPTARVASSGVSGTWGVPDQPVPAWTETDSSVVMAWLANTFNHPQPATTTFSAGAARAGYCYGGVLALNGKVVLGCGPQATEIQVYDYVLGSVTAAIAHSEVKVCGAFHGGVLLPSGTVVLAPYSSGHVGLFDPATNIYTSGPNVTSDMYDGAVLMPNGKVLLVPNYGTKIAIYDPVANTVNENGPSVAAESGYRFSGGVLAPNGKVILVPQDSDYVGIYDPIANTYTRGAAHGMPNNAFLGGVLAPNGKIVFVPFASAYVGIYDPVTDVFTQGPEHGEGNYAFNGGKLTPDGRIVFSPSGSAYVGIYDPVADTYIRGSYAKSQGTDQFAGAVLVPNGKVVLIPYTNSNFGIYDPSCGFVATESLLTPWINKL